MHNTVILLMLLPLLGAGLCLLERFGLRPPFAKITSVIVLLSGLGLLLWLHPGRWQVSQIVYTIGGWPAVVGIQQVFDGLAWMSCVLVFALALLALCFAIAEDTYDIMFYVFFLINIAGLVGVILAADLFNLFVCLEIVGLAAYILIAYLHKGHAVLASFKYLVLSSLGMSFVLLGIWIIYQQTGSLALFEAGAKSTQLPGASRKIAIALAALITGIGVRTAFLPFHSWLPEAHAHAPHPVSALLSGVVIKISFLAIWRIVQAFQIVDMQSIFIWIGAATALLGVCGALAQTDCKQLLAWHSISQMGYILASFGVGTSLALTAAYVHLINHALFKSLLFLSVGSVIHLTGERNLKRLGNLASAAPVLALTFYIGAGSIAGLPPLNGFISKKIIMSGIKAYPLAYWALWGASVGTVASFVKLSAIFRRWPQPMTAIQRCLPGLAYAPLTLLAFGCVVAGIGGSRMFTSVATLLCGPHINMTYSFYSLTVIGNTVVMIGLGLALYWSIRSQAGQQILGFIRRLHPGLDLASGLVVVGFLLLSLFSIVVISQ